MTNDHPRSPKIRASDLAGAFLALCDLPGQTLDEARCLELLATQSATLLDVDAAGILLSGPDGALSAVAASCETARLLQLLQMRFSDGPGVISFRTRIPVHVPDLHEAKQWESFRTTALRAGYSAVHALPLRRHAEGLGALTLFRRRPGALSREDTTIAVALSTMVTSFILDRRALDAAGVLTGQLQTALRTRIVIEQAKGVLAERHERTPDEAFELMRRFARQGRKRLDDVARAVIAHAETVAPLLTVEPKSTAR
ncbi:GAF and ANTAR domain-containing protein [Amycolatopsis pithecellobii]|uniref:ANTAR domain-containing protein n=1 Tax=Amycolatopsis pithecellobii TaxID=664692 RepID=A0A6N7Z3B8_9PSEU|nr:GAF and ANTAR domain-containing protein [Amycolatopsis pithecellobii]MTD54504.1 ANTAR domain-containing protein [Amycolatopsis pithecellobii]